MQMKGELVSDSECVSEINECVRGELVSMSE